MIERLSKHEGIKLSQGTNGQRELLREYRNKLNRIIDAVNEHEDWLCGCDAHDDLFTDPWDDDEDETGSCDRINCPGSRKWNSGKRLYDADDFCPDCRMESAIPLLGHLSKDQLQQVRSRVSYLLKQRSQKTMMEGLDDDCDDELPTVDTTDGLFSHFAEYVAGNPGLRLHQAYRNWSGYSKIYGELKDGVLQDTFYQTTKGPKK